MKKKPKAKPKTPKHFKRTFYVWTKTEVKFEDLKPGQIFSIKRFSGTKNIKDTQIYEPDLHVVDSKPIPDPNSKYADGLVLMTRGTPGRLP